LSYVLHDAAIGNFLTAIGHFSQKMSMSAIGHFSQKMSMSAIGHIFKNVSFSRAKGSLPR